MSALSENLKNLRLLHGYSVKYVAEKLSRVPNTVTNWEKGTISPPVDDVEVLCKLYNVSPNQIFGWDKCQELEDFLNKKKEILKRVEDLQYQKAAIERELREYNDMLNRGN